MGLIKLGLAAAAASVVAPGVRSASSVLSDQYKEYFYCEALPSDVIAVKATKVTKNSSNKGNDNVISDGSVIAVADGQCMMIVEQGKVVDFCAEPGEYTYSSATAPSLFTGSLGENVKKVFAEIGKRFTFGGVVSQDQRIYYFNTKELPGQKYGTPSPVPFRVVDRNIGLDLDTACKCFGEYSLRVCDPVSFYTNVCGNFAGTYRVSELESQLKSELLTALQPAFAKISALGVRYSEVVAHTEELADALNENLSKKWREYRGIEIVNFGISSMKISEEDEKMIKEAQRAAIYRNADMAGATLVDAQAQAMKDAAKNTAGAAVGFMGMNMAQSAGGANANAFFAQAAAQNTASAAGWTCPSCGTTNSGNFCTNCGTAKPAGSSKWYCPQCGSENSGNFCTSCGTKKPQ